MIGFLGHFCIYFSIPTFIPRELVSKTAFFAQNENTFQTNFYPCLPIRRWPRPLFDGDGERSGRLFQKMGGGQYSDHPKHLALPGILQTKEFFGRFGAMALCF